MNDFKWAYGRDAHLKEPTATLKEKGWQYADIPTASNVNWLFNTVQKEMESINSTLRGLKESVYNELNAMKQNVEAEVKTIKERATAIKTTADSALRESTSNQRNIDFATGISRQICNFLRLMEQNIQKYHTGFPSQPWPMRDDTKVRAEEDEGKSEG